MRCQIGDTTNGIALHFDVRAQHLSNKRLQASQFDDKKLIVGYRPMRSADAYNALE